MKTCGFYMLVTDMVKLSLIYLTSSQVCEFSIFQPQWNEKSNAKLLFVSLIIPP